MDTTATRQDLTALSPRQIDELWAPFASATSAALNARYETRRSIAKYSKVPGYLTSRLAAQDAKVDEAAAAEAPFRAEWKRRGGWTRYEL
ncbi:MAG TPA: hypothetical protein VH208_06885, partial [Myxococcaceae bacterium]|nr:hypothetical protein [Myxococcaceae bacterium]